MNRVEKLSEMTFGQHLYELRRRLLRVACVYFALFGFCYLIRGWLYSAMIAPLRRVMSDTPLIYTRITEAFVSEMNLVAAAAFLLLLPYAILQVWQFVAPGLYAREKRSVIPYVIAAPIMFLTGIAFAYFLVLPSTLKFMLGFSAGGAEAMPKISEYFSFVVELLRAFGICFMLPVAVVFLGRTGIIDRETLEVSRKWAFLGAFMLGAVLTPPDVTSQIALALPLYALYEVALRFVPRR